MFYFNSLCYFCRRPIRLPNHGVCCFCLKRLPEPPVCCPRCGLPAGSDTELCGRCLLEPPSWLSMIAVGDYQDPLKRLVIDFKFQRRTELAAILARLFVLSWLKRKSRGLTEKPDLLLSVPLHKNRRWRRGFNQTELLAGYLARWLNCRWESELLKRVRSTPTQRSLTAEKRRRNLDNAFEVCGSIAGLNIALLDDVVTTGSTIAELSRLLLECGAKSVQVWCICRTLMDE